MYDKQSPITMIFSWTGLHSIYERVQGPAS